MSLRVVDLFMSLRVHEFMGLRVILRTTREDSRGSDAAAVRLVDHDLGCR
jgi:hypothetical protein